MCKYYYAAREARRAKNWVFEEKNYENLRKNFFRKEKSGGKIEKSWLEKIVFTMN